MKKYLTKIASIFSILLFTLVVVAGCSCGQKQLEKIELKEGSIEFIYEKDAPADFSDIVVYAHYNDGTKVTLGEDDLTISEFSTNVVGTHEVTIKYEGKEIKVQLTVTNDPDAFYTLSDFEQSISYGKYLDNSVFAGGETEEEQASAFTVTGKTYVVGDENDFTYRPNITAYEDGRLLDDDEIPSFRTIAKLYLKDGNDYVLLTGEDLTANLENISDESDLTTGEIIETDFKYNFTQAAVGSEFKLEVKPFYMPEGEDPADMTKSITFKVVDGYNVTEAVELGFMVNANARPDEDDYLANWNSLFVARNKTRPATMDGIILHNNITLTPNDIPVEYFETPTGTNGKYLVDYADIYTIGLRPNETFNFYGNYFTLDVNQIPSIYITVDGDGVPSDFSHASLFKTKLIGDSTCNEDDFTSCDVSATSAKFNMQDVTLIGNANRSNSAEGFGGLIMGKFQNVNNTLDNVNIQSFYINTYTDQEDTGVGAKLTMKNVKSYNAYQNLIFSWGGEKIVIENSILKKAGGPAILLMNPYDLTEDSNGRFIPTLEVDEVSVIESWVIGTEAWFVGTEKTELAGSFSVMDGIFRENFHTTFKNDDGEMNVIAVVMTARLTDPDTTNIQGKVTVNEQVLLNKNDEPTNPLYATMNGAGFAAPIFTTDAGGAALYKPSADQPLTDLIGGGSGIANLARGEYLTIYQGGIGVLLGGYRSTVQAQ